MKVLVVRQPWAWLIVNGFKDIENRSWNTRYANSSPDPGQCRSSVKT